MKNSKITDETRDKYVDATVAVFMDQYAAILDAGIDEELADTKHNDFPPELDERCRALIGKEFEKKKKLAFKQSIMRVCRSAAVVAIALLSICSVLFVSVEAFRNPIINFFIEKKDGYWEVSGENPENAVPAEIDFNDPLAEIVPSNFELVFIENAWDVGRLSASYSDGADAEIFFSITPQEGMVQTDAEDASTKSFQLITHDALLSVEGNIIRLTWTDEKNARIFTLCATNLSEETVLDMGEEVALKFG